jgi:hypothetical protein
MRWCGRRSLPAYRQGNQVYCDDALKRLFDKINRLAANLRLDTAADGAPESKASKQRPGMRRRKKKWPQGPPKPLKTRVSAKEIQAFPWLKFGQALLNSPPIWPDLDFPWIFLGPRERPGESWTLPRISTGTIGLGHGNIIDSREGLS